MTNLKTALVLGSLALAVIVLTSCNSGSSTINIPVKSTALVVGDAGTSLTSDGNKFEFFLPTGNGTTAPQLTVSGSNTTMHRVESIVRDFVGNVYVGDNTEGQPGNTCTTSKSSGQILIFARGASGSAAPIVTVAGSNTTLDDSIDGIAVDGVGNIAVTQRNTTADACAPTSDTGRILFFSRPPGGSSNPSPSSRIIGTSTTLIAPRQMVVDVAGQLWTADEKAKDVVAFATAGLSAGDNNVAPTIKITSASLNCPQGIALDSSNNVYVSDGCANGFLGSIFVFKNVTSSRLGTTPDATINGTNTLSLNAAFQIATDGQFIYVGNTFQKSILVFKTTDSGTPAPTRVIFDSTGALIAARAISL